MEKIEKNKNNRKDIRYIFSKNEIKEVQRMLKNPLKCNYISIFIEDREDKSIWDEYTSPDSPENEVFLSGDGKFPEDQDFNLFEVLSVLEKIDNKAYEFSLNYVI